MCVFTTANSYERILFKRISFEAKHLPLKIPNDRNALAQVAIW